MAEDMLYIEAAWIGPAVRKLMVTKTISSVITFCYHLSIYHWAHSSCPLPPPLSLYASPHLLHCSSPPPLSLSPSLSLPPPSPCLSSSLPLFFSSLSIHHSPHLLHCFSPPPSPTPSPFLPYPCLASSLPLFLPSLSPNLISSHCSSPPPSCTSPSFLPYIRSTLSYLSLFPSFSYIFLCPFPSPHPYSPSLSKYITHTNIASQSMSKSHSPLRDLYQMSALR